MRAAIFLIGLLLALPAQASDVVWRSPSSGVLPSPVAETIPELPGPSPTELHLSYSGNVAVAAGSSLSLTPAVSGADGKVVSFLLFGSLPPGTTFDAATGEIGGMPIGVGIYSIAVAIMDAVGASTMTEIEISVS